MQVLTQNKFDRAESFLKTCKKDELELTAGMFGISLTHKRETLVSVPRSKEQLASAIIEHEENRIASEKGLIIFSLSEWGKNRYQSMSLSELKVEARYKGVSLTYKTYRLRLIAKTPSQLINEILYETNYADAW